MHLDKKVSLIAGMMILFLVLWPVSRLHPRSDNVAERFRNNVVHLSDGEKSGFGFVVAEEDGKLYVATALHVIVPDDPDIKPDIQVRFYQRQGKVYLAKRLELSHKDIDLALLEVPKPFKSYKWERKYFHPRARRDDEVWFVGRGRNWYIPTKSGIGSVNIESIAGKIHIDMNSVQVGTSGAPLISEKGIVGMIIEDEGADVIAVDIDSIRRVVTEMWRYPWDMEEFPASDRRIATATKLSKKATSITTSSSTTTTRPTTTTTRATTTVPSGPRSRISNSLEMEFVYIQPGSFMMGSPENEPGRDSDEKQHRVKISKGFYMQTTEVTQGQWKAVMGSNPPKLYFKNCGSNCPVERVSWNDVQEFIKKLNRKEGTDKYRLPTEAEWEYAARAGSDTTYCFGDNESELSQYAWYGANSESSTHPVGQLKSNDWGLYDMHGNVWEWCGDWYGDYPSGSVTDPRGSSTGSRRVLRGGGWGYDAGFCRSAYRNHDSPGNRRNNLGFRLALSPGQ